MIMTEHFEQQWLMHNIVDKRACHGHTKVLYVKKAERRSFATVLYRFCGKRLVIAMHKIELTENVRKVGRNARYFDDNDAKFELGAQFQVTLERGLVDFVQASLYEFSRQIWRLQRKPTRMRTRAGHIFRCILFEHGFNELFIVGR